MVLVASMGCSYPNPAFDDDEPGDTGTTQGLFTDTGTSDGADDAPPGDSTSAADEDTGTTGVPGDEGSSEGSDTGVANDETSTGEFIDRQIVLFQGPAFPGNAVGQSGQTPFNFAANECRELYNANYGDIPCPTGQVWGLLGSGNNPLGEYPQRPGGAALEGLAIMALDQSTVVADSYTDLIAGDITVPLVGHAVGSAGVELFWWGESSTGDPASNCMNWTSGNPGVLGAAIMVDDLTPSFAYEGIECNQPLPVLCVCF